MPRTLGLLAAAFATAIGLFAQGGKVDPKAPTTPATLQSAIASGAVEASFVGTGTTSGDSIRLTLRKTMPGLLVLGIAQGTMLRSDSFSTQNMVITGVRGEDLGDAKIRPASRIELRGTEPVTFIISAYCTDFEKANPTKQTKFTLADPDRILACIVREGKNLSLSALQAAVWTHTDSTSYGAMTQRFKVSRDEWEAGVAVANRCGGLQATGSLQIRGCPATFSGDFTLTKGLLFQIPETSTKVSFGLLPGVQHVFTESACWLGNGNIDVDMSLSSTSVKRVDGSSTLAYDLGSPIKITGRYTRKPSPTVFDVIVDSSAPLILRVTLTGYQYLSGSGTLQTSNGATYEFHPGRASNAHVPIPPGSENTSSNVRAH